MDAKYLKLNIENKVAMVTIYRPEKRNSISPDVLLEMEQMFNELSKAEDVNVVVLTGGEKYFCSGFDLNYIGTLEKTSNEDYIRLFHRAARADARPCRGAVQPTARPVRSPLRVHARFIRFDHRFRLEPRDEGGAGVAEDQRLARVAGRGLGDAVRARPVVVGGLGVGAHRLCHGARDVVVARSQRLVIVDRRDVPRLVA